MATDIIARGMAANAKKSVTELGNKVESEKWIGTKAEWEAVDKSTIKDGTIVYITDDKTVILYDKAEMEKIATQVATDRKAAETAAQTAQAVADSLPEDYVTAVGKIAENTAEIGRVKLTDKELKRRVDALFDIGQGITHQFETDSDTAYAKTIPTGAKLMSVKSVGGRSIVWNQLVKPVPAVVTGAGVKATFSDDGIITLNGTATTTGSAVSVQPVKNQKGHKYLMIANPLSGVYGKDQLQFSSQSYGQDSTGHGTIITNESSNEKWYYTLYVYEGVTYDNVKLQPQIFDLTAMFGSGNEPASVEEFEAMFPNDYYQYNAGEIVSAGTESVVEQGANLCDPTIFAATYPDCISVKDDIIDIISGKTAMFESGVALKIPQGYRMTVIPVSKENGAINGRIRALFSDGNIRDIYITDGNGLPKSATNYVAEKDISAIAFNWSAIKGGYSFKMQITRNATDSFTPYHRTTYPIPETIRNLPGYGWSAGTARNYVDYENKRYVQCVSSVDLGTLTFTLINGRFFVHTSNSFDGLIKKPSSTTQCLNAICSQFTAISYADNWADHTVTCYVTENEKRILFIDSAYTDAAAFKQAMQGVIMYYELATPIVTDISTLIDDDFLRNLTVEAGGSITFKGGNDDYRIPVPSEEEYIVKLSEVGGSV